MKLTKLYTFIIIGILNSVLFANSEVWNLKYIMHNGTECEATLTKVEGTSHTFTAEICGGWTGKSKLYTNKKKTRFFYEVCLNGIDHYFYGQLDGDAVTTAWVNPMSLGGVEFPLYGSITRKP